MPKLSLLTFSHSVPLILTSRFHPNVLILGRNGSRLDCGGGGGGGGMQSESMSGIATDVSADDIGLDTDGEMITADGTCSLLDVVKATLLDKCPDIWSWIIPGFESTK